MLEIVCPHCNKVVGIINIVVQDSLRGQNKEGPIYKTRLEMAKDDAKPIDDRRWVVIEYDSEKDKFLVVERKDK